MGHIFWIIDEECKYRVGLRIFRQFWIKFSDELVAITINLMAVFNKKFHRFRSFLELLCKMVNVGCKWFAYLNWISLFLLEILMLLFGIRIFEDMHERVIIQKFEIPEIWYFLSHILQTSSSTCYQRHSQKWWIFMSIHFAYYREQDILQSAIKALSLTIKSTYKINWNYSWDVSMVLCVCVSKHKYEYDMYGILLLCDVNDSGEKRQLNYIKMRDGVTTTKRYLIWKTERKQAE